MLMLGRRFTAETGYRYGFNGKENDNEAKGEGNQQDYGMRIYDPRVSKFLSIDPLLKNYPMLTPYQFASNNPVAGIDLDGGEILPTSSSIFRLKYLGTTNTLNNTNNSFVVEEVYQNIPRVLNYQLPGPPLHPSGRDWDINKDGFHWAYGLNISSSSSKSVSYFTKAPGFYDPLQATQEELQLSPQRVRLSSNSLNKISNKTHYTDVWTWGPEGVNNPSGLGAIEIINEYQFYSSLFEKMDVWSARRSVEKNRRAFYSVAAGILKQIEKWPAIKSAFPFSMTSPNLLQNARADLTNFVLDGTLPQNIPNGLNTKQFSIYVQNIYTIGTAILKANNHEVQLNTTNNYIELLKKLMPKENVKHEPKFIVTPNN